LATATTLLLSGCVLAKGVKVRPMGSEPVTVESPVKAHLKDGSTVVFKKGVTVANGRVRGDGKSYDLELARSTPVSEIRLEDVAAMEQLSQEVNGLASVGLTLLTTFVVAAAATAGTVAIFGSCPTVYSNPGASPRLEAETFSYSIVPLFEARDLDRLEAQADADGSLRLEVRDEALETHYINQLQLVEVRHAAGEAVMPGPSGGALVVGPRARATTAVSRDGIDRAAELAHPDADAVRTPAARLAAARAGDLEDWIDLTFAAPAATDRAALVLRARSSLLNTVLFYDVMLADAGLRAVDWLSGLGRISNAVELGRFFRKYMGLRVLEWRDDGYHEVARVPDPGPIAWHDVAVSVPVRPGQREVRLRLAYVVDAWRIDSVALASSARRARQRVYAASEVTGATGLAEPAALRSLHAADRDYLRTTPGQRFVVRFEPAPLAPGERRTLLLASQGYYTEWLRGDWLKTARPSVFRPGEPALLDAIGRWREQQGSLEARFEKQRVPVL
jgi:hypothetical protein